MSKHRKAMNEAATDLSLLLNRHMQRALRAGITAATRNTHQDSSNAAFHWLVAEVSKGRPGSRKLGTVRDLRATNHSPGTSPVGKRGDKGKRKGATTTAVRQRENQDTIERVISGRNPPGRFRFYHGLSEGKSAFAAQDAQDYADNADIEFAGEAAVAATIEAFNRYVKSGNVRKGRNA